MIHFISCRTFGMNASLGGAEQVQLHQNHPCWDCQVSITAFLPFKSTDHHDYLSPPLYKGWGEKTVPLVVGRHTWGVPGRRFEKKIDFIWFWKHHFDCQVIGFSFYDNPKNPNKAKERKYFQVYVLIWFNNGEETKHKQTKDPQYWLELNDLSPVIGLSGFRVSLCLAKNPRKGDILHHLSCLWWHLTTFHSDDLWIFWMWLFGR